MPDMGRPRMIEAFEKGRRFMFLALVDHDTYDYRDPSHSIILETESDWVPSTGDLIKDGHSRAGFNVYRVEGRVFRSRPAKSGENVEFSKVYLVVSTVASH